MADEQEEVFCRICSYVAEKNKRRLIFTNNFHLWNQLSQVVCYCPQEKDGLSPWVCMNCYIKLRQLSRIDYDLEHKMDQLRQRKTLIMSSLRAQMKFSPVQSNNHDDHDKDDSTSRFSDSVPATASDGHVTANHDSTKRSCPENFSSSQIPEKKAREDETLDIKDKTTTLQSTNGYVPNLPGDQVLPGTEGIHIKHIKTDPVESCDISKTASEPCLEQPMFEPCSGTLTIKTGNDELFCKKYVPIKPKDKMPITIPQESTVSTESHSRIIQGFAPRTAGLKDASTQTQTSVLFAFAAGQKMMENNVKKKPLPPLIPVSPLVTQKTGLASDKSCETFTLENVNKSHIPDLLYYYTGFDLNKMTSLFHFFFPNSKENPVKYTEKCDDIDQVSFFNQLFLVLCRLRQGFDLKDLAFRFNIKPQTVGVIFDSLVHYMYLKFTNIPLWKNRQTILENFPISHSPVMCVFGCTELKTRPPLDTDTQSMDCPDYKPNSTLKGLIAIDPRGAVSFVSVLFSENISDEKMCKNSGFLGVLAEQKSKGVFADGDFIMTKKESKITVDLSKIGLCLTQPPELPETGSNNLTSCDTLERRIEQIREFKLVGRDIPVSLFSAINEVWFVCALLVNFQNATFHGSHISPHKEEFHDIK